LAGDLMQQREVSRLADLICHYLDENCIGQLDALINNAGCVRSWYSTSEEGYEQQFALNHLAGFFLTLKLLPQLIKARGRILFTGSGSHKGLDINWTDIMFKNHYRPLRAYKQSKLCNMLTARELNHRLAGTGVRAYVVDPGLVRTDIGNKKTGGLVSLVWSLRKKQGQHPDQPAKTYVWLCSQNPAPDGLYYFNCQRRAYSRYVTEDSARRLFEMSEKLRVIS
jgi:NAD(P)-dependent dehydrogenase (short-subunit alcohol dehydrogenase family)